MATMMNMDPLALALFGENQPSFNNQNPFEALMRPSAVAAAPAPTGQEQAPPGGLGTLASLLSGLPPAPTGGPAMSPRDALLTSIGMSLLAPRQRGQSRGGHIMSAMGQGLGTYNAAQAAEQQRLREERRMALAERAQAANIAQSMAATEASQERTKSEREGRPLEMELKQGQIAGQKTEAEYKKTLMKSQQLNQQIDELKIQEAQAADPVEQGRLKLKRARLELKAAELSVASQGQNIAESKQRMAQGQLAKETNAEKTLKEYVAIARITYPGMTKEQYDVIGQSMFMDAQRQGQMAEEAKAQAASMKTEEDVRKLYVADMDARGVKKITGDYNTKHPAYMTFEDWMVSKGFAAGGAPTNTGTPRTSGKQVVPFDTLPQK